MSFYYYFYCHACRGTWEINRSVLSCWPNTNTKIKKGFFFFFFKKKKHSGLFLANIYFNKNMNWFKEWKKESMFILCSLLSCERVEREEAVWWNSINRIIWQHFTTCLSLLRHKINPDGWRRKISTMKTKGNDSPAQGVTRHLSHKTVAATCCCDCPDLDHGR